MSNAYSETLGGTPLLRAAPGARHETICARLHQSVQAGIANLSSTRLLPPRSELRLTPGTTVCPDLSLVTAANGRLWLAAEIISASDHQPDTVAKKQIYEELKLPRLWIIDPRYDNVEIYHGSPYGIILKGILARSEQLTEKLIPGFQLPLAELFAP